MIEPNLDRFSWRGPREKYVVVEPLPDCDICGRRMEERFLKHWNGKRVCRPCINEIHEESELYGDYDHD